MSNAPLSVTTINKGPLYFLNDVWLRILFFHHSWFLICMNLGFDFFMNMKPFFQISHDARNLGQINNFALFCYQKGYKGTSILIVECLVLFSI